MCIELLQTIPSCRASKMRGKIPGGEIDQKANMHLKILLFTISFVDLPGSGGCLAVVLRRSRRGINGGVLEGLRCGVESCLTGKPAHKALQVPNWHSEAEVTEWW